MAPGWKATTDETGAYELIPASYEYQYKEIYVEIPRTAESPGLGVLLEQFGTLDAAKRRPDARRWDSSRAATRPMLVLIYCLVIVL